MGTAMTNKCAKQKQPRSNQNTDALPAQTSVITPDNTFKQTTPNHPNLSKVTEKNHPYKTQAENSEIDTTNTKKDLDPLKDQTTKGTSEETKHEPIIQKQSDQSDLTTHQQVPNKEDILKAIEIQLRQGNTDHYFSDEDITYYQGLLEKEKEETDKLTAVGAGEKQKWILSNGGNNILGKGSFGTVVIGHNKETGEIVAIKLIDTHKDDRKQKYKLISEEVTILKQMRHQNIVRYYGIQEHKLKERIGIVCEYISGGSLWQLLQKFDVFQETLIKKYTRDILLGLEYLHYHGLIHRDIKGANILVTTDGVCKLADFGLAKSIAEKDDQCSVLMPQGTPNWMAPEVCRQGTTSTRFSDIWSLGCTIIEMVTGKSPYANLLPETIILRVGMLKETPQLPSGLSPQLSDFLLKCLQINPEQRYNVRQLLNHPFITELSEAEKAHIKAKNQIQKKNKKNVQIQQQQIISTEVNGNGISTSNNNNLSQLNNEISLPPSTNSLLIMKSSNVPVIHQAQVLTVNVQQQSQQQMSNSPGNWNGGKNDSLRTILEESNQQLTNHEENTETNFRRKSPSLFHEEIHSSQQSNINNINNASINNTLSNNNNALYPNMPLQKQTSSSNSIEPPKAHSSILIANETPKGKETNEIRSSKQLKLNFNGVSKDEDEDGERKILGVQQADDGDQNQQIKQQSGGSFLNPRIIDEVDGEDDDENGNNLKINGKMKGNNGFSQKSQKNQESIKYPKQQDQDCCVEGEENISDSAFVEKIPGEKERNETIQQVKCQEISQTILDLQKKQSLKSQSQTQNHISHQIEFSSQHKQTQEDDYSFH